MNTPSPENPPASSTTPAPPQQPRLPTWRALQVAISWAILVATLFTLWTPTTLLTGNLNIPQRVSQIFPVNPNTPQANFPTATPPLKPRIGIVAGHWGNDSGAVCDDGLTEEKVNLQIATLTMQNLVKQNYEVDLLKEKDPRLFQYEARVLVSIHNDSCQYINDEATGFKVAAAQSTTYPEKAARLTACMVDRYARVTGLRFHYNSITRDMTEYHAFNEINSNTTAAIIETGFLNLDRQILTEKPDLVAQGVTEGILCYLRNESVMATAIPTENTQ
jgi:N-acetylmuramoyl-L-alanine amidase